MKREQSAARIFRNAAVWICAVIEKIHRARRFDSQPTSRRASRLPAPTSMATASVVKRQFFMR